MKALRPKQADWSKPFKLHDNREEFNRLDEVDEGLVISLSKIEKNDKKQEPKKEEIIKPRIEIVAVPIKSNNKDGIPLNYIRLTPELNLPRADKYELSEVDYIFLGANENKYLFGGKKIMTVELLERCFVELEIMTGRDFSTLPKSLKAKFKTFLEGYLDVMAKMDKLDEFVDVIYNRWRSRRDQLKNPLLRQLWRPQADDTSHFLAFRPREKDKEKRNLRRINKANQQDAKMYTETLLKEIQKSQQIVQRVLARQKYKLGLMNLQMQKFNIQVRGFKNQPLFVKEMDKKEILNLRQVYQGLKIDYQTQKESNLVVEPVYETTSIIAEDNKAAVCNFIANISSMAAEVGIDWETLGGGRVAPLPTPPQPQPQPSPFPSPVVIIPPLNNITAVKFNLLSVPDNSQTFLFKTFTQPSYPYPYPTQKPMRLPADDNPYFALKQHKLCANFFFDDDDQQIKDVKRTISTSFKRYLSNKTT